MREPGIFPYRDSEIVPIPHTDGTLVSVPSGTSFAIMGPTLPVPKPKYRGAIRPGGIGDTDYIDCNTTSHEVFTGSF
jgi:hypothetical protein